MKKITALLCALVLLATCLVSCGNKDDAPKGMVSAYIDGEPFKLYVPEEMTPNTNSGISGAYANVPNRMMVTARYYTPSEETTLELYLNFCAQGYADSLDSFDLVSTTATVLSGVNAYRMEYTAKINELDYTCTQTVAFNKEDIVSLNIYVPTESLETCKEFVEKIVAEFVLCDKPEQVGDEVVDDKTPEGMKIASDDSIEYRLYVPKSWICKSDSGKSEAYYPESARSNVTMTSYSPNGEVSLSDYVAFCKEEYAKSLSGYALVEETETTLDGKSAVSIVFTSTYDGVTYKQRQVIVLYGQMFYTLTYTATAENYELHTEDVEQIISAFTFR